MVLRAACWYIPIYENGVCVITKKVTCNELLNWAKLSTELIKPTLILVSVTVPKIFIGSAEPMQSICYCKIIYGPSSSILVYSNCQYVANWTRSSFNEHLMNQIFRILIKISVYVSFQDYWILTPSTAFLNNISNFIKNF